MINAKDELLKEWPSGYEIKCAIISMKNIPGTMVLKINHNEKDLQDFLKSMDFVYDYGFGSQKLFGTVWFKDGTWLSRYEIDGAEWWIHNVVPEIPKLCY